MSGFFRVAFKGEFYGQAVVNILHYRSAEWLPGQGNPFDDTLAALDVIITELKTSWLNVMHSAYKLNTVEGVGYDNSYAIVTASPLVRTINEFGTLVGTETNGAATCAILALRCGEQQIITGIGSSKRNRGYLALGPLGDVNIDNLSHLSGANFDALVSLGEKLDNPLVMVLPEVTLTPIRIHACYTGIGPLRLKTGLSYSDVLGFAVRRVTSFRRSRVPEA